MNRKLFFNEIRSQPFGGRISTTQVTGVTRILDAWEKIAPTADLRFIACSLATVYHETGETMQPVREIGQGRGKRYGVKDGPFSQIYYGRGDVQLTWLANYVKADKTLRARGLLVGDENLVKTPDLALRPDISAAIMILGMLEGWFTGRKLSQFFRGTRSDWIDSRTIINGHDRAALIASYGLSFYHALKVASSTPVEDAA